MGNDLAQGRLVEVLPECLLGSLDVYAVYPSRKHLSVKIRVLIDYLVAAFNRPDWAWPHDGGGTCS
ncbi:MAG: hypothetical protein AB7S62_19040 [Azoarcus sp.]